MFKISVKPQWQLANQDGWQLLPRLIELLASIQQTGALASACRANRVSYRYAWGLLQQGAQLFGVPLVRMARGRGAELTPLAEKLVWADRRIAARLAPMLDSLASELEAELERALSDTRPILRMQASHGFAVQTLRDWLARAQIPLDLKYRSSMESVAALYHGDCDLAGFHVPTDTFESSALDRYARWLKPVTQRLVHLATRDQGLMLARGNPKHIGTLEDLLRGDVRFVNRQTGSGTRMLLDLLLERKAIDSAGIQGFDDTEYTHAAVAAYVASGMADAGFGLEAAARQFSLDFIPIAQERYFLLCDAAFVASPGMKQLLHLLRDSGFRRAVDALPGYDSRDCGREYGFDEAFGAA